MRERLRSPLGRAVAALLLVVLVGCVFHHDGAFFDFGTHQGLVREVAVPGILACGMTVVILTSGIDLAVGSTLALSAVLVSLLAMPRGFGAISAAAIALLAGSLLGATSGTIVGFFRLQPFVVTLAAMVFARGFAKHLSQGKKISRYLLDAAGNAVTLPEPRLFTALDSRLGGIPVVTIVFAVTVAIVAFVLGRTRLGRYVYAVGGNAEAARLSGVPVRAVLIAAYTICGLTAAIAGICQAAQETHGDPETGLGYELDAIAMVVIGGTSLAGGRGGVGLTLLGVLTIGYLHKILSLNAFATDARLMLTGAIIVAAALFQRRK
jgi:ribose transport system permease protein